MEAELATSPSASTSAVSMERKRESVLPPKQPVDLMSELVSLREKLGSVDLDGVREEGVGMDQWKERLERLTVLDTGQTAGEDQAEDQKPAMSSSSNGGVGLSELDKRLAQLEDLIGPPSSGPDDVGPPLSLENIPADPSASRSGILTPPPYPREARPPPLPPHPSPTP